MEQHKDSRVGMKASYDVVVVGCGPVGAVAAKLLAKGGLEVLVLDKAADVFDKPRAIGIDHEAMRILQFCDVAHALFPHVRPFQGSLWQAADGTVLRSFDPAPPPHALGWPANMTFLQPQFERLLRDSLAGSRNVDMALQTEAVAISQDPAGVQLTVRDLQTGDTHSVRSRYLVGADGASSVVRAQLGVELEDLQFDEWWIVVDMLRTGEADYGNRNVQYCTPERPGTYVVGPGQLRRWEFRILPHESPDDFRDPARVLQMMAERVDLSGLELWRSAVYRFHALVAHRWHDGRIFLAGDAAHQTPPHLGQGMVSGLRDAANLAWKILHVEAGADPRLFDSYMAERRPHFHSLVSTAKEFGCVIGVLDPAQAAQRDAQLLATLQARTTPETRQNHIPPLTQGLLACDADGTVQAPAGQLFLQPRIRTATGERLLDDAARPRFQLLSAGDAPQSWLDDEHTALWQALGGERLALVPDLPEPHTSTDGVQRLSETDGRFAAWMAAQDAQIVVVRPDRYIYGVARDAAQLRALLQGLQRALLPASADRTLRFHD
jgi:3-(3-hydroxy-phenyl)propionate hydroxylase